MKYNVEQINELAAEHNWKLISNEYKNLDSDLTFECSEGHKVFTTFKKVRDKWECPVCAANQYKEPTHTIKAKKSGVRRVLALDQASYTTGYAIFDNEELIDYGIFETQLNNEVERFNMVKMWLISMINNWKPDYIGLEGIQFEQKFGVTTFQTLARLQGILMECCFELKVPFEVCATNTWRHHCGVKGRARADKKRSMQLLAKDWYDISVSEDRADAIGIGKYMAEIVVKRNDIVEWE